jgi:hypothetical protein
LLVGVGSHLREFLREPLHVLLLVVLPPLVIEGYGRAMGALGQLPFLAGDPATLGRVNGAIFAAAFLAGLVGLFQVISAIEADERLVVCGFDRGELFVSRLATVVAVSLVAAGVTLAVLLWQVEVDAPVVAFGALALAALVYGVLGVLVGTVVPRELEGSLVLVFVADMDDALASGLVEVDAPIPVTEFLPLHYPHAIFEAAVTDGTVATGDVVAGVAYALVALAAVLVVSITVEGGVGS